MHCATGLHLKATKRVNRYVKGTSDFGVKFTRSKEFKLVGFCNSDWEGSIDDMRSASGYCFTLSSVVFSWSSKKQETVAQSTVEAEFIVATATVNQALWLRFLLTTKLLWLSLIIPCFVGRLNTLTSSYSS
ncbi:UNVERIFIED_CONTAM: Copia protein [Sesamum indicum]